MLPLFKASRQSSTDECTNEKGSERCERASY